MYKQVNILRNLDRELHVYRCFENIDTGQYFVQSKDTFVMPIEKHLVEQSQIQLFDLFLDDDIEQRCEGFDCLKKAIESFDSDFD